MVLKEDLSIHQVARALNKEYGACRHHNKKNPLDEIVFIICSIRRVEHRYLLAYKALKRTFRSYKVMAEAPVVKIRHVLAPYGLQNEKAYAIKEVLAATIRKFGTPTLSPLKRMTDGECETFLLNIHGIGRKVARCVMMYSLGREVFPVDSNCWRIAHRLGWLHWQHKVNTVSNQDMDLLQGMVPKHLRASLHSDMISHGRNICTVQKPRCGSCVIVDYCKNSYEKA